MRLLAGVFVASVAFLAAMSHRGREYPHPDAPEITMFEHTPNDPDCQGCKSEAALAALVSRVETLEAALAYVVAWVRQGEGDESTAAELADAALSAGGTTPPEGSTCESHDILGSGVEDTQPSEQETP